MQTDLHKHIFPKSTRNVTTIFATGSFVRYYYLSLVLDSFPLHGSQTSHATIPLIIIVVKDAHRKRKEPTISRKPSAFDYSSNKSTQILNESIVSQSKQWIISLCKHANLNLLFVILRI